jgi:beta-ribofuranosylaminobenzene 5'-phosphate synthase
MTSVLAPSRLHFGLLNTRSQVAFLRQFGGCGLMIDQPGIRLQVQTAEKWTAEGPSSERAMRYAQQLLAHFKISTALQIHVLQCPEEHVGLGVGTQLALATALAVQTELKLEPLNPVDLAQILGRGARSAIGLHGFRDGGFLVDAGRLPGSAPAPLLGRYAIPDSWRILLIRPRAEVAIWSGSREVSAFQKHQAADWTELSDKMCRWLVLGIIPALLNSDFSGFSESIYEFNRLAGEQFRSDQGGVYSSARLAGLVQELRQRGVSGVGQSSWGPTLFAFCETNEQAEWVLSQLSQQSDLELVIAKPANHGATVTHVTEATLAAVCAKKYTSNVPE